jgi:lysophospholipase L1-like esterase
LLRLTSILLIYLKKKRTTKEKTMTTAKAPQNGDSPTTYNKIFEDNADIMNPWSGKTMCSFGDSITAQNLWQPKLDALIGFSSVDNKGVSGSQIGGNSGDGMVTESRIESIPDVDLLLFMGGTNDWASNRAVGNTYTSNIVNGGMDFVDESFINWTSGGVQANALYECSSFYFPIEPSTTYRVSGVKTYALYDGAKSFLSGENLANDDETTITTGATSAYIRVSAYKPQGDITGLSVSKQSNDDTVSGSASLIIERLQAKYPNMTIVVMGTPYGKYQDRSAFADKYGLLNNLSLSTIDYASELQNVAKRKGVHFIDIASLCGWGDYNIRDYVTDDGALLHPNDVGASRMASVIYQELQTIAPRV